MPIIFRCGNDNLVGILHMPAAAPAIGVVIVTGGPQYRVGSHRQFVMLARDLAAEDIAVLRFDCRGMGDSDGQFPGFELIEPDVAAAVAALKERVGTLRQIVLWGLCDATLAICRYARRDPDVSGVVLLNPWVRSEAGYARAQLKHYYLARLLQRDFMRKLLRGEFNPFASARSLFSNVGRAVGGSSEGDASSNPLAEQMAEDLLRFKGRILVVLSGRDLTAKEFADAARSSAVWRRIYAGKNSMRFDMDEADHTFSRRAWRDEVASRTLRWIRNEVTE